MKLFGDAGPHKTKFSEHETKKVTVVTSLWGERGQTGVCRNRGASAGALCPAGSFRAHIFGTRRYRFKWLWDIVFEIALFFFFEIHQREYKPNV